MTLTLNLCDILQYWWVLVIIWYTIALFVVRRLAKIPYSCASENAFVKLITWLFSPLAFILILVFDDLRNIEWK